MSGDEKEGGESDYTTMRIPWGLAQEIDRWVESRGQDLGYRNRSEFALEAIRRRLEEVKQKYPQLGGESADGDD